MASGGTTSSMGLEPIYLQTERHTRVSWRGAWRSGKGGTSTSTETSIMGTGTMTRKTGTGSISISTLGRSTWGTSWIITDTGTGPICSLKGRSLRVSFRGTSGMGVGHFTLQMGRCFELSGRIIWWMGMGCFSTRMGMSMRGVFRITRKTDLVIFLSFFYSRFYFWFICGTVNFWFF